jgi:hypothetical protein
VDSADGSQTCCQHREVHNEQSHYPYDVPLSRSWRLVSVVPVISTHEAIAVM